MKMRTVALVVTTCTAIVSWCQQVPTAKPGVSDLVAKLHSKDWTERSEAVDQIRSDLAALHSRKVRGALIDLLDREKRQADESFREAQKPSRQPANAGGGGDEGGEAYGEYFASLREMVDSFGDWNDPRQACIMVSAGYVDYSSSPTEAADRARAAMPCLLKMSKSDLAINREIAAPMLLEALANANDRLDPETLQNARGIILGDLQDADDGVRVSTVDALGKFGGTDMIPALQQVAAQDPSPEVEGHSIRKSAAAAITEIQRRTGQR
jgi:HEAT repeat protein